jgi:hypothetical protein
MIPPNTPRYQALFEFLAEEGDRKGDDLIMKNITIRPPEERGHHIV